MRTVTTYQVFVERYDDPSTRQNIGEPRETERQAEKLEDGVLINLDYDHWFTGVEEVETVIPVGCAWFALCSNDAAGTVPHPVLGPVPCCESCCEKMGMAYDPFPAVAT